MNIREIAKEVFAIEALAIEKLAENLTEDFDIVIDAIVSCKGKVIISGMGKSGIIAKKIAATMASTGTPSFFLHPGEAYHGDLGMIEKEDMLLLLSNSGETDEILKLIPFLKEQGNIIVAISGNVNSTLAKNATFHLNVSVEKEACPLQLAPTSSTTATLVMGDALAVTLMKVRGFREHDFAQFHPGGSLGKRLLTKVKDVMIKESLPIVALNSSIQEVIQKNSSARLGLVIVVEDEKVRGVITDGDIRRAMENSQEVFFQLFAVDLMSKYPKTVNLDEKLTVAQKIMTESKVNSLLVLEKEALVGVVQIYDLEV